jgi:hypothetical protein
MTQWNRKMGGQITGTSLLPAWRAGMGAVNTLYEVGYAWNDATHGLVPKYVWPETDKGGYLYSGTDGTDSAFHAAYGAGILVPELGTYGTMVYGATGEGVIIDQLSSWALSDANPEWNVFQQPVYVTTEADAITANADWYYNPTAYGALDAAYKVPENDVAMAAWIAAWDKNFPIGWRNWVMRRKYRTSLTGNNRPHFFRYDMPCYIPPAMSGGSAGSIIVNSRGTIYGPFPQGPFPTGGSAIDWYEDIWATRRKHYLWAMNVQTKVWTRLPNSLPDMSPGYDALIHPMSVVDTANKRVYYSSYIGSDLATYYANFSAGQAAMTVTAPSALTAVGGGADCDFSTNHVFCVPQSGALAGKRLWFFRSNAGPQRLGLIDLDANTVRTLYIPELPVAGEWWGWAYNAASNRVYIITKSTASGVKCYHFVIPDNYTNAASYAVSLQTISLGGVTLEAEADAKVWQYGQRTCYHPALGVILMTQVYGKMLAFRPA